MTAAVTASRSGAYETDGIRNAPQTSRSDGVTDKPSDAYDSGSGPVTCKVCGGEAGVTEPVVIIRKNDAYWLPGEAEEVLTRGPRRWIHSGDQVCWHCCKSLHWWPWIGPGVTHPRRDYYHECLRCRRRFVGAVWRRYCSDQCRELDSADRRRERNRDERLDREAVRSNCDGCARQFTPGRHDARYCSNACRQRAYRQRSKETP